MTLAQMEQLPPEREGTTGGGKDMHRCGHCGKSAALKLRCGRCRAVYFCDRDCQRAGWKRHKPQCRLQEVAEAKAATQL